MRWPTPQAIPLVRAGGRDVPPLRRRYLRVTGETNPGLDRRVDSLIRRIGMTVQNRSARGENERSHLGFLISPCDDAQIAEVAAAVTRLGRVKQVMVLGVSE